MSCVGYADYDVEFLHNENGSGYIIVVTDPFGERTKVSITEKEFMQLVDNPSAQKTLVTKITKAVKPTGF